jgi:hypothetical protein
MELTRVHPVGAEGPSFEEWESVIGQKAELMAGNHQVEAFQRISAVF